ncbi:LADA_0F04104g1_1 [Lachancea dasiensis]|uniref:DNA mismatch repair protein n=1 Tax=Lachancea dasiensis TaxID=1072105 RepID=A0A1G4JJE9_9SACH|nr:LADA_0F04104g1_1 [Lachancea dasiensis]
MPEKWHRSSPLSLRAQKKFKQASVLSFFGKNKSAASTPIKKPLEKSLFVENDMNTDGESDFVTAMDHTADSSTTQVMDNTTLENSKVTTDNPALRDGTDEKSATVATVGGFPEIEKDNDHLTKENVLSGASEIESLNGEGKRATKRQVSYVESSDDDEDLRALKPRKRNRSQISSDDEGEEEEYVPPQDGQGSDDDEEEDDHQDASPSEAQDELKDKKHGPSSEEEDDGDEDILRLSDRKPRSTGRINSTTSVQPLPLRRPNIQNTNPSKVNKGKHSSFNKENEQRYQWLVDEQDANGRSTDDPDHDPRTLYIPPSAWAKFTPFEKQYWEIKSRMWDCIVFFKKGKFFEMYEKDAMLGNHLFDLKIAGGGRANMQLAGIPEMSFDYWAMQFIQHGYKVAKVDQRESMLAKEMRDGNKGIVKRELQSVLTSGTLTDSAMLQSDQATYCLAIREEVGNFYDIENGIQTSGHNDSKLFGVAFIDTATGEIEMLEFEDDSECTKLDTVLSQVRPKEIIMEKNNLSNMAHKIVKYNAQPQALFNYLKAADEYYDFNRTFDELTSTENRYFTDMNEWPAILKTYYEKSRKVGFSAFGGLLSYLKWLQLDSSLISMKNIKEYNPIRSQTSLVLDGVTLQNLEIFGNSFDNSDRGTLFKLLNRAITPMGKRMLKKWVIHPLLQKDAIERRLDSVDLLLNNIDLREILEESFSALPDLERFLARIHSGNLKIKDFNRVIEGFETIVALSEKVNEHDMTGSLALFIKQIPQSLKNYVNNWSHAFDRKKAVEEGVIIPEKGVEPDFDESLQHIRNVEVELAEHLRSYKKSFKTANIQYKDSGKEIYTIEIPITVTKLVPSDWIQMGANKSNKRYYSPEVAKLARTMAEARETHKVLEEGLKSRLYQKFNCHYQETWMPALTAISKIDCLLSLARTSEALGFPCCRPQFVDECDPNTGNKLNGFIKFKELRHPCFNQGITTTREFIPNDINLGGESHQVALLTGANAAGKSTVLRMTCIAVIMAQIGCYVPAESAVLAPIDKIMTRLGANDNILQGKSTFFVELSETKKILDAATNRSLLILDELGRGGSSSDGFAIAESVLHHVATHTQSLGFFATHYGGLNVGFKHHPQVIPLKMDILVDESSRNITFLYKLIKGQSEGSFGMHVASMCGISKHIIEKAQNAADNQEHTSLLIKERQKGASGFDESRMIPLGLQSDFVRLAYGDGLNAGTKGCGEGAAFYDNRIKANVLKALFSMIEGLE